MPTEYRMFPWSDVEIRTEDGKPKLTGYAAVWGSESLDLGGFTERIIRGAFTESLGRDLVEEPVLSYLGHDRNKILGSTAAGTLKLSEDSKGLRFTLFPPEKTSYGADVIESVRRGDLRGMSFRFGVNRERMVEGVREVIKADLHEISPVSEPAYPDTSVQLRRKGRIMKLTEIELRQAMGQQIQDAQKLRDRGKQEKRTLTPDERNQISEIAVEYDRLVDELRSQYRKTMPAFMDVGLDHLVGLLDAPSPGTSIQPPDDDGTGRPTGSSQGNQNGDETRAAFRKYLTAGPNGLKESEFRALQADSDTAGGFITIPVQTVTELLKDVDDATYALDICRTFPVPNAQSLGVPALENDIEDASWTTEIAAADEDTAMDFGKRELNPHPLAKLIKVSNKLLRIGAVDAEAAVRERMSYKHGIAIEKGFMTGTGAGQPLGLFTASSNGISTGRDVSTGNSTTAIAADGLIEALMSLKSQHQGNSTWIFHRDAVKQIRKLKDGQGQYLWQPGLTGGQPGTILERPYLMSEYVPNTFTTGLYVGIIGNFNFFWWAVALNMEIQRLTELYAVNNQAGFIGRMEIDGMPVLENAFARVTLA